METARSSAQTREYDVVGPVCETGDFLGKDRELAITEGDLLAVWVQVRTVSRCLQTITPALVQLRYW